MTLESNSMRKLIKQEEMCRKSTDQGTVGAAVQLFRFDLPAGANADHDIVVQHQIRVIDAWLVLTGAGVASSTSQVKYAANAITSTMAASGSDGALVRITTIDDAYHTVAAGGTLRVTTASGATAPAQTVYVLATLV